MITVFLLVIAVNLVGYTSAILIGLLGAEGDMVGMLLPHLSRWLLTGPGLFGVSTIAVFIALVARNYPVPIGYLIFASMIGLFSINWSQNYLVPWCAPLLAGWAQDTRALATVLVLFLIGSLFGLFYFSRMDVD